MRTYDEAYAAARDEPPFSNSGQGYGWMENWCDRCSRDADRSEGGCSLIAVAFLGLTPIEWLTETPEQSVLAEYRCIEFRDRDNGREPTPMPGPPDQGMCLPMRQGDQ